MTNEKALNRFNAYLYECPAWCRDNELTEQFEAAVDALRKQVPMKPIERGMFPHCPICGKPVVITDFETDITMKFCIECGQRIDWSEEN